MGEGGLANAVLKRWKSSKLTARGDHTRIGASLLPGSDRQRIAEPLLQTLRAGLTIERCLLSCRM